jgi:ribosomal subunit interface protein
MTVPLQITYRNVEGSPSIEAAVKEHADKLEKLHQNITNCRVAVESPHHSQTKGNHYRVRIDVTIPGNEIIADRGPSEHDAHEDIYVAIRDAFRAAQRELHDFVERRRELRRQT